MRAKHNRIRLICGNIGIVSKWNRDSVSLKWKIIKFMARISSVSSLSSTDFFFFKVWYLHLLASARKMIPALAQNYTFHSFICSLFRRGCCWGRDQMVRIRWALPFLYGMCKWEHTVFVFPKLVSFTTFRVHIECCKR